MGKDRAITTPYNTEAWRERLNAPNYRVGEAARYARTSASNVARWHKDPSLNLPVKEVGAELSYVQLIEVAVVAACRRAGLKMNTIRETRDYMEQRLGVPHPFATKRFKTDGRNLVFDLAQTDAGEMEKLVNTNLGGQLEWNEILQSVMREFDYDGDSDLAVKWHVGGMGSPIIIDPRISFGSPAVGGVATWLLKARYLAGEPIGETARDFGIKAADVKQALKFERIDLEGTAGRWAKRHSSSIGASESGSQN